MGLETEMGEDSKSEIDTRRVSSSGRMKKCRMMRVNKTVTSGISGRFER